MTATPDFGAREQDVLSQILAAHRAVEGALLPILHAVQDAFGFVPPEALPLIARDQNISRAEAHGVMSFYHDFREHPAGRSILKICRAEACQAMGADALADHARDSLKIDWHETTPDGAITLEPVIPVDPFEHSYDLVLYSEFETPEALRAYATHPDHVAVAALIRSVVTARVCVDYEV